MRILLVDGDEMFARLLKLKLEKWGHKTHTVHDGDAAWEELQRQAYRVIITELRVPGMDGPELCRRVRKLGRIRYTYVLFYSALKDHDSITEAYESGADDYMTKPLNPQLLRLRLKNGKRLLNLEDELRTSASYDAVSGFLKYETFLNVFEVISSGAERYKYTGVVTFITIDNYQRIYDDHGYEAAIKVKEKVAEVLSANLRKSDLIANIGVDSGDFAVVCSFTPAESVESLAKRLNKEFAAIAVEAEDAKVSPEIGYATTIYPQESMSAEDILSPENRTPLALSSAA